MGSRLRTTWLRLVFNQTSIIKTSSSTRFLYRSTSSSSPSTLSSINCIRLSSSGSSESSGGSGYNIDNIINIPKMADVSDHNLSVERIYQKKTLLEQIILRPDTYIGSVEETKQHMWVYENTNKTSTKDKRINDSDSDIEDITEPVANGDHQNGDSNDGKAMVYREVAYVPGLYKIFDELLVNAADNKQRDGNMNMIKIEIKKHENKISVFNNGCGIPVQEHKTEKVYVPTLIFGHLLTSSNYNDEQKKTTGGRNGYGAKLCNIFSTKFIVETAKGGKKFKQVWENNMKKAHEPIIQTGVKTSDFTRITFYPDLPKFGMSELTDDIIAIMSRRAYDVCGTLSGVSVYLNEDRLPFKGFKDYVKQYIHETEFAFEETPNQRWQVALAPSDGEFRQVSFVNSIATTKGGKHVDYVVDMILDTLLETVKKKNKEKTTVTKAQAKRQLFVFVNSLIENPAFDSQSKEFMTLAASKFGSKCELTDKFYKKAQKIGVVDSIVNWAEMQAKNKLASKGASRKTGSVNVPKLVDAAYAGKAQSRQCTLILTEGDSAKGLAVSGTSVIGQHYYGIFPLRGKLLNVREAKMKQIMDNAEINAIIKILGLNYKKTYQNPEDLKDLRYGRIMIMTDQDADGSHIKGLIINFIHSKWPALLRHHSFFQQFITPIVKAKKGSQVFNFYSIPEFNEWKENTPNYNSYHIKYYKGLGTSTAAEAKEYFSELDRHRIDFRYGGHEDDNAIVLAFSKEMIEARKQWLMNNMEQRKRRREMGLPEVYLYEKNTRQVTYQDFVNKELVLFSNLDNERSIPSVMDGLKPGQRKVIFTCFIRNDKREVKVAQLAGSVAEKSAYHHGEASLQATIVNLAQDFVGSNNINLLEPIGQFGTRLRGGKDAASARYINTMLNPLTRKLFRPEDDPVLNYLEDDNLMVEPEYYVPIIPMVLVNGAEGIGTGWSTKVPMYNPLEIVANIKRLIRGEMLEPMAPWYRDFRGERVQVGSSVIISGVIRRSIYEPNQLEITELPIGTWTEPYVETVLRPPSDSTTKPNPAAVYNFIEDVVNYPDDTYVKMSFTMPENKIREIDSSVGLYKAFKLQTSLSLNSMVLFDSKGCLRRYESPLEIIKEFYDERRRYYEKRREYVIGMLTAECEKLENHARYIDDKVMFEFAGTRPQRKALIKKLIERGYAPDPVKRWKKQFAKSVHRTADTEEADAEAHESDGVSAQDISDYAYLFTTQIVHFTADDSARLYKRRDEKREQVDKMVRSTIEDLWLADLDELEQEYAKWLESLKKQRKEARDARSKAQKSEAKSNARKGGKKAQATISDADIGPSADYEDIPPPLDEFRKKTAEAERRKQGGGSKLEGARIKTVVPSKLNKSGDADFDASDSDVSFIEMNSGEKGAIGDDTIIFDDEATSSSQPKASDSGLVKEAKAPKATKEPKASKASKASKAPRAPKEPKEPKEPKAAKTKKAAGSGAKKDGKKKRKKFEWESDSDEEPMDVYGLDDTEDLDEDAEEDDEILPVSSRSKRTRLS